ncbi:MAG: hypothetical protein K2V38_02085, partial [Gemmataceae bacterium]|nr:hypothetical protein [Gemmataceae bacterium]
MLRALMFVLLVGAVGLAQPPAPDQEKDKGGPPVGVERTPAADAEVIRFLASPAAAPAVPLRYELLPRLRDRKPGNAALDYVRARALQPTWPRDPKEATALNEQLDGWESSPVEKLPVAEVKKYLAGHAQSFRVLDAAAKADRCDWELADKITVGDIDLLLTQTQSSRELARFQRLRVRVDLAEGDFDAAVRNIQTGLRLGKDVGEGSTLIQTLVGLAVASVFVGEVEQLIHRPNSPNLYWALTTLPRPLIDPRPSLEGEARLSGSVLPHAGLLEKGPLSEDRANAVLEEILTAFRTGGKGPDGFGAAGLKGFVAVNEAPARKQLLELGWTEA